MGTFFVGWGQKYFKKMVVLKSNILFSSVTQIELHK